jgi:hypothetical protein
MRKARQRWAKSAEAVPIGGGEDKPARVDVRAKRRGGQCRQVFPRASSTLPCRTVEGVKEAGEVDADVEVKVRGRQAVGDAIPISDRAKEDDTAANLRIEPRGARSRRGALTLICFLSSA